MRLTILLVLFSILAGCDEIPTYVCKAVKESCDKVLPVYKGEPLVRGGIHYAANSNEPLTARVERYHENGQLEFQGLFVNGKKEGLYQGWYDNGQLEILYTAIDGKKAGLQQEWYYHDNQLASEVIFVNSKKEGLYQNWHERGQL